MDCYRYTIGLFSSRERALAMLEDMFASGEICEGEKPLVERINKNHWAITALQYSF
ncbi:MAG: hypothetical protein KGI70_03300 [Patescibacteria group bacterium]|nr:hypothetical protein [Patescibacteria group bacterium]